MLATLYCWDEVTAEWLRASDPNCGWNIDPKYWEIECDHTEDWGSPVGGVVPCNADGMKVPDCLENTFEIAYF